MKTPPLLLLAALLFWGWQSDLLLYGALAGVGLEAARLIKPRWELEDVDFNRIWSFCGVVLLALGVYVFTNSTQSGTFSNLLQNSSALRNVAASSGEATTSVLRWLPLVFLPFLAAQVYNVRPTVPGTAMSMAMRIRRRRGDMAERYVDISYAYFMVCIASAGIHTNQGSYLTEYLFFFGQTVLVLWALWCLRSRRFGVRAWAGALAVIVVLGLAGQTGINGLNRVVQNLDAELFSHFLRSRTDPAQTTTSMGQIGRLQLSPQIVIRLQPDKSGVAPEYLREASYRNYDPRRRAWSSGGMQFEPVTVPTNNSWALLADKPVSNQATISCYLNGMSSPPDNDPKGVLPLPAGTYRLDNLPAYDLETNQTGVVLATGPALLIFDAWYGPGATIDSPPDLTSNALDLNLPENEIPALTQVLNELNLTSTNPAYMREQLMAFFARNFTYSTWQGPEKRGTAETSPLTRFLLTSRSGHCEYFASATVLMLRRLGIPARYAVGYAVHERSGSGFVVRGRDAHAWCLAWNGETKQWEDFDTTPASWVAIEARKGSLWDRVSDLRSWLVLQFEKLRWTQSNFQRYLLWLFIPVMLVLLYYILFQRRKRPRVNPNAGPATNLDWPGHDSAFYRLEKSLAARGLPRQPPEPLADWLERALTEPALAGLRDPLRELLQLHYRYRFDPRGLSDDQKRSLVQNASALGDSLARIKTAGAARQK